MLIYRWRGCPLHIVEVISAVHLREALMLSNDDTVILIIDSAFTDTPSLRAWLAWLLLWAGRRSWYYRRGRWMVRQLQKLGRLLGCSQE
ncbi:hypothetical protein LRD18_02255 [Halorhodospira halochloris]|uniref:hypothetical protein n=1 Tax=Halorhodospira halochloris TaxID=1052 RepID=UPI001EE8B2E8|nr:hypothetical protein [Halorhodospira halochloris]MCG5529697.1 hypothetical protein [Halorhodospira halochloris]